jgi:hypothetical protein
MEDDILLLSPEDNESDKSDFGVSSPSYINSFSSFFKFYVSLLIFDIFYFCIIDVLLPFLRNSFGFGGSILLVEA